MNSINLEDFGYEDEEEIPPSAPDEAPIQESPKAEESQEQPKIDLSEFEEYGDETWGQWATRNALRGSVRTLEGFAGVPGELRQFMTSLAQNALKKDVTEEEFNLILQNLNNPEEYQEIKDQDIDLGPIQKTRDAEAFPQLSPIFDQKQIENLQKFIVPILGAPTTEEIKSEVEKKAAEFDLENIINPRNYFEERFDDVMTDLGSIAFPGGAGRNPLQKLGIAVGANLGEEALKGLGVSEKNQSYGKMGLMFALDLATKGNGLEHANQLLGRAEDSIPRGIQLSSTPFARKLNNARREITRGGSSPSKQIALEALDSIESRLSGNTYDASELPEMNRVLNEYRGQILKLPSNQKKRAHRFLNQVQDSLHEEIQAYGQNNPKFLNLWQRGNEAFSAYQQSQFASNFIEKNYKQPFVSDAAKLLFFSSIGQAKKVAKGAAASAALAAPYQAAKVLYRVYKSPELARYYGKTVSAAMAGDTATMNRWMRKLDKKLAEEDLKKFSKTPLA